MQGSQIRRWALAALFCTSIVANAFQGFRILTLEDILTGRAGSGAAVGARVPSFIATRLDGENERLTFGQDSRPTIVYVFSPSCIWCERNSAALTEFAANVGKRTHLIGISLLAEGTHDFVLRHQINFPVYTNIPDATASTFQLGPTPQTILVSTEARIQSVWTGVYDDRTKSSIEHALSIVPSTTTNSR
jgi:hypothetical protein